MHEKNNKWSDVRFDAIKLRQRKWEMDVRSFVETRVYTTTSLEMQFISFSWVFFPRNQTHEVWAQQGWQEVRSPSNADFFFFFWNTNSKTFNE